MAAAAPAPGMAGLFGGQGPTAYVNSLYAPLQAQLQTQQKARLGTLNDLVGSILASLKAPQPDVYGAAAQDQTSAANGAAATLARVNPDAQTQAMLRAIGAPQSQQDQVGQQNNVTFNGQGALGQYVGGALPAGVFAQDQQARDTYLKSLPATVGLSAIQGLGHLNLLASNENGQLAGQKASAQQKALSDLANYVQQNRNFALRAQGQQFNENLAGAKYKTQVDQFNVKTTLDYKRLAQSAYQSDRSYQVSLANLGISQKNLQLRALADEAKLQNGGFTPAQVQKFKGTALTLASNVAGGFTDAKGKVHPPLTYPQAVTEGRKEGVPLSILLPALKEQPQYKTPGQNGVPLVNNGTVNFQFGNSAGQLQSSVKGGGFLPKGASYTPGRADQGRDFQTTPGGPIIAPGNGRVVAVKSDPNGFGPSYPVVYFTSGPYAGQFVYVGHTLAALMQGASFKKGQVISRTGTKPVGNASVPGWAEIGFAPGGNPGPFGQTTPFG